MNRRGFFALVAAAFTPRPAKPCVSLNTLAGVANIFKVPLHLLPPELFASATLGNLESMQIEFLKTMGIRGGSRPGLLVNRYLTSLRRYGSLS